MKNRNFIITSLQSWDIEIGSTIKSTALEISKQNRVMYINPPLDLMTWLRRKKDKAFDHRINVVKGCTPAIRQINPNMWVIDCPFIIHSINKLPITSLFDWVNKINNKKISKRILEAVNELNFKDYIHLIDTDIYRSQYLKELIHPAISIYYCRDFVIGRSYWKKHGTRLEPILAKKSDIVLTNSTLFAERFKKYNTNTFPIETGVDLNLYDSQKKWELPDDLKIIPHPIIGYVGVVTCKRLDSDLLLHLAEACPKFSFVFTGPEDVFFKNHKLHQCSNVYFLGKKNISDLPAYIFGYDICINPQIVNEITEGNYPLKIDEYLSMGKPTIATSTHTMQDIFKDHVFLPTNKEEYILMLNTALSEINDIKKQDNRIRFAHTHSWENSVNKIYQLIESKL